MVKKKQNPVLTDTQVKIDNLIKEIEVNCKELIAKKEPVLGTVFLISKKNDYPMPILLRSIPEQGENKHKLFESLGHDAFKHYKDEFSGGVMVTEAWALKGKRGDEERYKKEGYPKVSEHKDKKEILCINALDLEGNFKMVIKDIKRTGNKVELVEGDKVNFPSGWMNEKTESDCKIKSLLDTLIDAYKEGITKVKFNSIVDNLPKVHDEKK